MFTSEVQELIDLKVMDEQLWVEYTSSVPPDDRECMTYHFWLIKTINRLLGGSP